MAGKLEFVAGVTNPVPYGPCGLFARVAGDGWSRIGIRTTRSPVDLMGMLSAGWRAPIHVLWVLLVSRRGHTLEGRYECAPLVDFAAFSRFQTMHRDFLEQDRHRALWLATPPAGDIIVYDNHEVLTVYGNETATGSRLLGAGYTQGTLDTPVPYQHLCHPDFDGVDGAVVADGPLTWSELRPEDG